MYIYISYLYKMHALFMSCVSNKDVPICKPECVSSTAMINILMYYGCAMSKFVCHAVYNISSSPLNKAGRKKYAEALYIIAAL